MMIRALGVALLVSGLALAQDSEPKPPPEFAALDAAFERAAARDTRVAILSHSEHDGLAVAPIVRWWRRAKLGEVSEGRGGFEHRGVSIKLIEVGCAKLKGIDFAPMLMSVAAATDPEDFGKPKGWVSDSVEAAISKAKMSEKVSA